LPRRTVVLAEDETDLLLFPPLRSGWAHRGEPVRVMLSGRNARRVIFGTLNLRTGSRLFMVAQNRRAADFQRFLWELRRHYRSWRVALLLDEDPSHTSGRSVRLAALKNVKLLWLPKRAPKLNPMETLWGQGKDVVSANKQYVTIDYQVDRFLGYLRSLSNREALETAGVHSGHYWLHNVLSKNFCGPA
jgi:hypothetical protein